MVSHLIPWSFPLLQCKKLRGLTNGFSFDIIDYQGILFTANAVSLVGSSSTVVAVSSLI